MNYYDFYFYSSLNNIICVQNISKRSYRSTRCEGEDCYSVKTKHTKIVNGTSKKCPNILISVFVFANSTSKRHSMLYGFLNNFSFQSGKESRLNFAQPSKYLLIEFLALLTSFRISNYVKL